MKIFYITSLDSQKTGGLFNATYERIKRHAEYNDVFIVNNNYYKTAIINFFLKLFNKVSSTKKKLVEKKEINGLTVYNHNIRITIFNYIKRNFKGHDAKRVVKLYKNKQYNEIIESNVIHAHWGMPHGYIAYLLGMKFNKPYFITLHGSDVNNVKKKNLNKLIVSMENAYKSFFVSEELLNTAIEKGYSGKNAIVTYNGADTNMFKLSTHFNKKIKNIVYVGSLEFKKGADLLPKIFNEIHINNSQTNFKVIGEGPLKKSIKEEVYKLNINNKVKFTGNIDKNEVPKYLEDVDLLVIPSRMEGLGMVVLEAHAMGIPVVGSSVGGIPEAIGDNRNVFDQDNQFIQNISKRAIEILDDDNSELNAKILRERVEKYFSWESVISIEQKYYESAIKHHKSLTSMKKCGTYIEEERK